MPPSLTYYELLGVSRSADTATLRSAFRHLSKELHPDTTSLPHEEAAIKFQQICEAYELLNDPLAREQYDLKLYEEEKGISESFYFEQSGIIPRKQIGERRPFSGGELFSLLLLGIALFLSLLLGIGFAILRGRELFVQPSWLVFNSQLTFLHNIFFR